VASAVHLHLKEKDIGPEGCGAFGDGSMAGWEARLSSPASKQRQEQKPACAASWHFRVNTDWTSMFF